MSKENHFRIKESGPKDLGITARIADVYVYYLRIILKRIGFESYFEPYSGYGNQSKIRLFGRVSMRSKKAVPSQLRRGIRALFTSPVPNTKVHIKIADLPETYTVTTDRGGYINAELNLSLEPGWHQVSFKLPNKKPVISQFLVISETGTGIISDVDDTVLISRIPEIFKAAFLMLFRNPRLRLAVPGMVNFYQHLSKHYQNAETLYVTASPWNVESSIRKFLKYNNFNPAPLIARDWGPTENALFLWGETYKYQIIEQVIEDFPKKSWILIGDDGQKDPTIYRAIADKYPQNVTAVVIRQLTPGEQIFAHWFPTPYSTPSGITVPVYYGPDGYNLLNQFQNHPPQPEL